MADSKISQLTSATTPLAGTEVLPIVQSGATKQVSIDNLTAGRNFSAGTITANIIVPTVAEFPDGTAAAPSITNTGDLDTGMYFPAANAVALVTAGVNRLRINSSGDVGIGTITPGARLDVRGSATFNEDGANVDFRVEGDTDANLFFVDASADFVGIGTNAPTQKLTVAGSTTTVQGNTITSNNLAGNAFSLVSNSDATAGSSSSVLLWNNNGLSASSAALSFFSTASSVSNELRLSNGAAAPITFYTNGSERVRIDSSGNVGIGTATPASKLDVNGTITATGFSVSTLTVTGNTYLATTSGSVGIGTTSPAAKLGVTGNAVFSGGVGGTPFIAFSEDQAGGTPAYWQWSSSTGLCTFYTTNASSVNGTFNWLTAGAERMRLDSSGNLLVGGTSPVLSAANRGNITITGSASSIVSVGTSASAYTCLYHDASGGDVWNNQNTYLRFGTNNTERMRITSTGDVGIGTSSPGSKLHVNGDVRFGNGTALGVISYSSTDIYFANLVSGGALTWYTNGAERMRIDSSGNVGIGTSSPSATLSTSQTVSSALTSSIFINGNYAVGNINHGVAFSINGNGAAAGLYVGDSGTGSASLVFTTSPSFSSPTNTERMRITAAGDVGIGTSSPASKLHVEGANGTTACIKSNTGTTGNYAQLLLDSYNNFSGTGQAYVRGVSSASGNSNTDLTFGVNASGFGAPYEAMRLDSAGNLGLGVTPSAWGSSTALQVGSWASLSSANAYGTRIGFNNFYNGTNDIYSLSNAATKLELGAGVFKFFTAPSGTAGNTISFTQAMTLDASGNLGVGTSSPNTRLEVSGAEAIVSLRVNTANSGISASNYSEIQLSDLGAVRAFWRNLRDGSGKTAFAYNNHLAFLSDGGGAPTERMRITSTGDVGIGTGSPAAKLQVTATGGVYNAAVSIATDIGGGVLVQSTSSGTNSRVGLFLQGSDQIGAAIASAREDAGATWKTYLSFYTNNLTGGNVLYLQEKMRITSAGDVGIGTSSPVGKLGVAGSQTVGFNAGLTGSPEAGNLFYTTDGTGWQFRIGKYQSGAFTSQMVFTDAGNIGIGTTSPTAKLDIVGSGATTARLKGGSGTNQGAAFYVEQAGSTNTLFAIGDSAAILGGTPDTAVNIYTAGSVPLTMAVGGTEKVRITSAGDVGIGTASPAQKLTVSGGNLFVSNNTAGSATALVSNSDATAGSNAGLLLWNNNGFSATAGSLYFYSSTSSVPNELRLANGGAAPITFYTNGSERMRLDSTGRLLVGTASTGPQLPSGSIQYATTSHIASGGFGRFWVPSQQIGSATYAGLYGLATTYNAYYSGGWKSIGGGTGGAITIDEGIFAFSNTNSVGAADQALTWTNRLVIDTSGNVGIGTSSPLQQLHLSSASATGMQITYQGVGASRIGVAAGNLLTFGLDTSNGTTTRMAIDSSGNLGLGVTPSAWKSDQRALQIGASGSLVSNTSANNLLSSSNAYFDAGAAYRYIANGFATQYEQYLGKHAWYTAPSGTAGNAIGFTQAMTLDASGSLGVGVTDPDAPVTIQANSGANAIRIRGRATGNLSYLVFRNNANSADLGVIGSGDVGITFDYGGTERARIDSSGNLLVGTTSTSALTAFSGGAGGQVIQSGVPVLALVDSDDTTNGVVWLANSYGVGYLYTKAANPFIFGTNGVEKMRLTEAGNLLLGKTASAYATTNRTCLEIAGTSTALIEVKGGTSNYYIYNDGTNLFQVLSNAGAQVFYTNNAESMRVTATGNMQTIGGIYDANVIRIANPKGAHYVTTSASISGAIKIVLPVGGSNTMIRMTVRIYEYATGYSFDMHLGGYNYNDISYTWYNVYAYAVGSPSINRQFSVRFGYDSVAGKNVIYIGELSSSWAYPQVYVTDVQLGYSGYSDTWAYNWSIGFETSAFAGVTQTITNPQIGYQAVAGDAVQGSVKYTSTTNTAGCFYGGTTTPTGTNRLNYSGYLYPTFLNLEGSADTSTAATHYFVETGNDGYVRPKTLANVQTEIVTSAAVSAALGGAIAFGSGTAAAPSIYPTGDTNTGFFFPAADTIGMSTGGVERVRVVDSAVGIGITPSARSTNFYGLQVAYASMEGSTSQPDAWFSANARYDSSWKYIASYFASIYEQAAGRHSFYTTTSGTAGNTIAFSEVFRVGADKHVYTQGGSDKGYKSSSDVAWTSFTLQNSYTQNTTTPFQYRRVGNMVEIHGVFEKTAGCGFAEVVAALPSGLRPTDFMYVVGTSFSDNAPLGLATTFEIAPASGNIFISLPLASGANYKGGFSVTFTCIS